MESFRGCPASSSLMLCQGDEKALNAKPCHASAQYLLLQQARGWGTWGQRTLLHIGRAAARFILRKAMISAGIILNRVVLRLHASCILWRSRLLLSCGQAVLLQHFMCGLKL